MSVCWFVKMNTGNKLKKNCLFRFVCKRQKIETFSHQQRNLLVEGRLEKGESEGLGVFYEEKFLQENDSPQKKLERI